MVVWCGCLKSLLVLTKPNKPVLSWEKLTIFLRSIGLCVVQLLLRIMPLTTYTALYCVHSYFWPWVWFCQKESVCPFSPSPSVDTPIPWQLLCYETVRLRYPSSSFCLLCLCQPPHSIAVCPVKPFVLHVSQQQPDSLSCGIQQDCFSSNKADCCFLGEKKNN